MSLQSAAVSSASCMCPLRLAECRLRTLPASLTPSLPAQAAYRLQAQAHSTPGTSKHPARVGRVDAACLLLMNVLVHGRDDHETRPSRVHLPAAACEPPGPPAPLLAQAAPAAAEAAAAAAAGPAWPAAAGRDLQEALQGLQAAAEASARAHAARQRAAQQLVFAGRALLPQLPAPERPATSLQSLSQLLQDNAAPTAPTVASSLVQPPQPRQPSAGFLPASLAAQLQQLNPCQPAASAAHSQQTELQGLPASRLPPVTLEACHLRSSGAVQPQQHVPHAGAQAAQLGMPSLQPPAFCMSGAAQRPASHTSRQLALPCSLLAGTPLLPSASGARSTQPDHAVAQAGSPAQLHTDIAWVQHDAWPASSGVQQARAALAACMGASHDQQQAGPPAPATPARASAPPHQQPGAQRPLINGCHGTLAQPVPCTERQPQVVSRSLTDALMADGSSPPAASLAAQPAAPMQLALRPALPSIMAGATVSAPVHTSQPQAPALACVQTTSQRSGAEATGSRTQMLATAPHQRRWPYQAAAASQQPGRVQDWFELKQLLRQLAGPLLQLSRPALQPGRPWTPADDAHGPPAQPHAASLRMQQPGTGVPARGQQLPLYTCWKCVQPISTLPGK